MKNDEQIEKETAEFLLKGVNNLREFLLKQKDYVKKYYKCRKVHGEVLDSMLNYIYSDKYDFGKRLDEVEDSLIKEASGKLEILDIDFNLDNEDDFNFFVNLAVYKVHPEIVSVVEEYLLKNKFKVQEKVDMLKAMQESFISFFKIINKDYDGKVILEDLVTNKQYEIIDISLSNPIYKNDFYLYSRLITVNGISFLSILTCFPKNIKKVNNYIKSCKRRKKNKIIEILEVYNLNKEYGLSIKKNYINK